MSSENKIKCKLFYTYLWDCHENYDNVFQHIVREYSNWEEVTEKEYDLLEQYVFKHNYKQKEGGVENPRYLFLVKEPPPGLPASLISEIIFQCKEMEREAEEIRQKKEAEWKIQEENKQKLKLERDKKRFERLQKKIVEAEKNESRNS